MYVYTILRFRNLKEAVQMEKVEKTGLYGLLVDSRHGISIGLQLQAIAFCRLQKGLLLYIVGLEIQHRKPIRLQQGAVHLALQQHLILIKTFSVFSALIQYGKFKFPQTGAARNQLPADFRFEEGIDFFPIQQLSLVLCEKSFFLDPLQLLLKP